MKYSCDMIRDLLPLYLDDVASPTSRQLVEEHLSECADCRRILNRLKDDEAETAIAVERQNVIAGQRRSFERKSALVGSIIAGIFMIPILVCLIVNLATGAGLTWFFIVLAALLVAASLSIVPLMAPENKGLWTLGCFALSLLLLLGVCCLYTGGRWFFVAGTAALFGLAVVFLPFVVRSPILSPWLEGRRGLAVMAADTALFAVMMLAIGLYVRTPGFFPTAAAISLPLLGLAWALFAVIWVIQYVSEKGERTMKQATKTLLIIAACLVLLGGAVFCLTMSAHHWDFSLLGGGELKTETYNVPEAFQSISIRSDTEDITFCLSEDGACRVVCQEREKEPHTVSVQDGALTIERTDKRTWRDHISWFSFGSPTITVYLPQTEYASLTIEESTGDITIPKEFAFGSMALSLSTGDVDCRASTQGLLRVQTSTGDIHLEGVSAGELDLAVSTGKAEVRSVVCQGNAALEVSTGKATLSEMTCQSFRSTGGTGDITLNQVIAEETISIVRSTGDVRLEQCDAGELTIETDTGTVTGSLLSDKVFITHSDTGRIDVPETVTGGVCRITTDTGDIQITIA